MKVCSHNNNCVCSIDQKTQIIIAEISCKAKDNNILTICLQDVEIQYVNGVPTNFVSSITIDDLTTNDLNKLSELFKQAALNSEPKQQILKVPPHLKVAKDLSELKVKFSDPK